MKHLTSLYAQFIRLNHDWARECFGSMLDTIRDRNLFVVSQDATIYCMPLLATPLSWQKMSHIALTMRSTLLDLLKDRFANAPHRLATELGMEPHEYELIAATLSQPSFTMSRTDLLADQQEQLWVCETNVDSSVGGIEVGEIASLVSSSPLFKSFCAETGLHPWYTDPIDALAANLWDQYLRYASTHKQRPVLALLDWDTYINGYVFTLDLLKHRMTRAGFKVIVCHQRQLEWDGKRLFVDGTPLDLIYRVFIGEDALQDPSSFQPIATACREDAVVMVDSLTGELLGQKALLATLSQMSHDNEVSPCVRSFVAEHLPWTRLIEDRRTTSDTGQHIDLLQYVTDNREQLVIKPSQGYGGSGIAIGKGKTASQWESIISNAVLSGKHIVQRYVQSGTYPLCRMEGDDIVYDQCFINIGPYAFGHHPSGAFVRAGRVDSPSVVNVAAGSGVAPLITVSKR